MDKDTVKPLVELLDLIREIDGFPKGEDEDILSLSDPPFYTACPNPYIKDFIDQYGKKYDSEKDVYTDQPYIDDVREGRGSAIYNAISFHTKVPHKAIMKFIEHYTKPGDIVFDGFCGSGMTGVAARILNRNVILSDILTSACFISYNYCIKFNVRQFADIANKLLKKIETECNWLYETNHTEGSMNTRTRKKIENILKSNSKGIIDYVIWSDIFLCPFCNNDLILWDLMVDEDKNLYKELFKCPNCGSELKKSNLERSKDLDGIAKQVPVRIVYKFNNERYIKKPDVFDFENIKKIENYQIPNWYPTNEIPDGANLNQPKKSHGLKKVSDFYTKRNLWTLSYIFSEINKLSDKRIRNVLYSLFIAILNGTSKMARVSISNYLHGGGGPFLTGLRGTLFIPSFSVEKRPHFSFQNRINKYINAFSDINLKGHSIITTQSTTNLSNIPINSIDYIFTDPPFGGNLMYSELSFIWESWLNNLTSNEFEAIENVFQNKNLDDYKDLMIKCFTEIYCTH